MKRILLTLQNILPEVVGFALLIALYAWTIQLGSLPGGKELHLLEAARETLQNHRFFYPTVNQVLDIPISPLLTVIISLGFKLFSATILTARTIVLLISLLTMLLFYSLGARLFHGGVGFLSACFALATWGFFSNSFMANGAMLYLMLVLIALFLFFHWFDAAFRSRTFAKSLYVQFILLGFTLGVAFWSFGVPGVLYPVAVMLSTLWLSKKMQLLEDIPYPWFLVPFGSMVVIWIILGTISVGFLPFLKTLFPFSPHWAHLGEPLLYLFPILPLLFPAVLTKDIWNRGFLTYHKALYLMAGWFAWSMIFLLFCAEFHEAFSLLAIAPALLWIGFYLSEIFRNPLMPRPLQLTLDLMIIAALMLSLCLILLTFQIVPPEMRLSFVVLSFVMPAMAIVLFILKDLTISRTLPMYLVPCGLLLCILLKNTVEPWINFQPEQAFSRILSVQKLNTTQNAAILEWASEKKNPSLVRFVAPLKNPVTPVESQVELESLIQTRRGSVYLILPETQFYQLPESVREMGYVIGKSWHWRKPMTPFTMLAALKNETLDFDTLTEPVFLFEVPAIPES